MDSVRDVGAMEVMEVLELRPVAIQPWDAELSPTQASVRKEVRKKIDGLGT